MKLSLAPATLLGGTVGAYAIVLGGVGVVIAVRNMFGPAQSDNDLTTWMVFWRVPLGALIGSGLAAYLTKRRDHVSLTSSIGWSLLSTVLSTFLILPFSLLVIAFVVQTLFEALCGK